MNLIIYFNILAIRGWFKDKEEQRVQFAMWCYKEARTRVKKERNMGIYSAESQYFCVSGQPSLPNKQALLLKAFQTAGPHYCSASGRRVNEISTHSTFSSSTPSWSLFPSGLNAFSAAPIQPSVWLPSNSDIGKNCTWGGGMMCYEKDTCFSQQARANCSNSSAASGRVTPHCVLFSFSTALT